MPRGKGVIRKSLDTLTDWVFGSDSASLDEDTQKSLCGAQTSKGFPSLKHRKEFFISSMSKYGITSQFYRTSIMANVHIETNGHFAPFREGNIKCKSEWSEKRTGWTMTYLNMNPYTEEYYYGRGYIQLTHYGNYERVSKLLKTKKVDGGMIYIKGTDCKPGREYHTRNLTSIPDIAMHPVVAAEIAIRGMYHGWFTGISLKGMTRSKSILDYAETRKIVNSDIDRIHDRFIQTCHLYEDV